MKQVFFIFLLADLYACNPKQDSSYKLNKRIDSLEAKIADGYKPGFGEFMSSIQVHHVKLWFAGQNHNWKLADFEVNEIRESLEDIKKYCTDRLETKDIPMIEQPLQNVSFAIGNGSLKEFKRSYTILTATCNSCHQETNHGFNEITIPTAPLFSDQSFELKKVK